MRPPKPEQCADDLFCVFCNDDLQVHVAGDVMDEMIADLAITHVSDGTPGCVELLSNARRF